MKKTVILFVGLLLFTTSGFAQSRRAPKRISIRAKHERFLAKAEAAWPRFIARFRAALKRHDRNALRMMMSDSFSIDPPFMGDENERGDARDKLFREDRSFEHILDTLRKISPISRVDTSFSDDGKYAVSREGNLDNCWHSVFTFREDTGWLFSSYIQPEGGC